LNNFAGGNLIYKKEYSRSSFLLLKDGSGYQAYVMIVIADSSYIKNDLTKLDHNKYNQRDKDFSGIVLYNTPNGSFVSGWIYKNGKAIQKLPVNKTPNHTAVQNVSNNKKLATVICTDWWQETYVGDNMVDRKYLGTTCQGFGDGNTNDQPAPIDGGGGDGGFISPGDGCGGCSGGGGSGGPTNSPDNNAIEQVIENKPFAFLFDVDCATLKKWLAVAKFTPDQSIIDKLNTAARTIVASSAVGLPADGVISKNIAYIQKINDAYSTVVNMDYFPVTVSQLPIVNGQRLGPGQFLNYIRTHINDFTDHSKTFAPYNYGGVDDRSKWTSTDPKGAIVAIDLPGPDDASVLLHTHQQIDGLLPPYMNLCTEIIRLAGTAILAILPTVTVLIHFIPVE
jgi:hypothetical protein